MFRSQEVLTCQELRSQAVMKTCSRSRYGKSGGKIKGKEKKKKGRGKDRLAFSICLCFEDIFWQCLAWSEVRIGSKPESETIY